MEVEELAKEWRIWVLLLSLVGATLMLGPSYGTNDEGEVIINTNLEDRMGIDFTGGTRLLLAMNTSDFNDNESEHINESSEASEQQQLANRVRDIIEIRVQQAGLADPSVRTVDIGGGEYRVQVEVGASNQSRIEELIKREGSFEARMPILVSGSRNFTLDETYTFSRENSSLLVEQTGESYEVGERFELDGSEFAYVNQSEDSARVEVVTYTGAEISDVLLGDQSAGVGSAGPPYSWQFPIVITSDAAQDLNNIAQNYEVSVGDGGWLIHENGDYARMNLYVDGDSQSSLRMSSVFQERPLAQSQISGGEQTREAARESMNEMAAILQSGSLPVPVYIDSISQLSSALGSDFLRASMLSIIGSLIAVGLIVTARYQNPKIALPIVFTGAAEVYIMLGFWFTTIGSLSLSAIAGIIAAVGTGVDDQIIITDESDREVITSWAEKMKRAFFVIFTSAASTIGAMLPIIYPGLMSMMIAAAGIGLLFYNYYSRGTNSHFTAIGIFAAMIGTFIFISEPSGAAMSTIHDFAWTTIIGIMVGITITRPAFAKVIEQIDE
jgi:preprotein translocase subunit SecD